MQQIIKRNLIGLNIILAKTFSNTTYQNVGKLELFLTTCNCDANTHTLNSKFRKTRILQSLSSIHLFKPLKTNLFTKICLHFRTNQKAGQVSYFPTRKC